MVRIWNESCGWASLAVIDGYKVIDFHAHSFGTELNGMKNDVCLMLRAMDLAGVDIACVSDVSFIDGTTSNDLNASFVALHSSRFLGFAYVSPVMPDNLIEELARAIDTLGFVGIKLYPRFAPWDFSQQPWHPIYQFADERGLPVLIHTDASPNCQPRFLREIAPLYPNATFVAGHSGNTSGARSQAIAAAHAHSNVYLETCSTFRAPGVIEQLVSEIGAERVLFGTDMPLMDPRAQLGKIITARISDDAKRRILGENARSLLGI